MHDSAIGEVGKRGELQGKALARAEFARVRPRLIKVETSVTAAATYWLTPTGYIRSARQFASIAPGSTIPL